MAEKILKSVDEEELEAAQEAAKKNQDGLFTVKFKKPMSYDGQVYDELTFDMEGLTGADSLDVEREMNRLGIQLVAPAFSGEYIIRMAARACTSPVGNDVFRYMSAREWLKIRSKMRNFFMAAES